MGLFDQIHDSDSYPDRMNPATQEEFIDFGLSPEDYTQYVILMNVFQGMIGFFDADIGKLLENQTFIEVEKKLFGFCKEKKLITGEEYSVRCLNDLVRRENVKYFYGWFQYSIAASDFRLNAERQLSKCWDESVSYRDATFGGVIFLEDYFDALPESKDEDIHDTPVRIAKFNPENESHDVLEYTDIVKLLEIAQREKEKAEYALRSHEAIMPTGHNAKAAQAGLPWIKKLYRLNDYYDIVLEYYGLIKTALATAQYHKFTEKDTLWVIGSINSCQDKNYVVSKVKAEFEFNCEAHMLFDIERCETCHRYQMERVDFKALTDVFGWPSCQIVYDGIDYTDLYSSDFSDFPETSVFYDMGYTVSQSENLSAETRQKILRTIIEDGLATKDDTLKFLSQRININGMKSGNELAFQKWLEDYKYIKNLE